MNMPEMTPVQSSNVAAIGYDAENEIAYVEFIDGKIYIYKGVPEHEYNNLFNAPSIGSYLHRNFKNVYPYERIN